MFLISSDCDDLGIAVLAHKVLVDKSHYLSS